MSLCISPETKRSKKEESRLKIDSGSMMQFLNLSSFAEQMLIHEHALCGDQAGHPDGPRRADRLRGA
ncbi:MAG: hypothetical protein R3E83_17600 [Burkholderiaceae bacterium]